MATRTVDKEIKKNKVQITQTETLKKKTQVSSW